MFQDFTNVATDKYVSSEEASHLCEDKESWNNTEDNFVAKCWSLIENKLKELQQAGSCLKLG